MPPDPLADLRSPQEQRRTEAAEQFRARALHQGSVDPAGVAAVPYLIGLLADGSAPDRTLGHELLTAILPGEELDRLSGAPDGPLPDGASPADLSPQQHAAAHTVAQSGLADHPAVARLLRECNLPSSTPLTA